MVLRSNSSRSSADALHAMFAFMSAEQPDSRIKLTMLSVGAMRKHKSDLPAQEQG